MHLEALLARERARTSTFQFHRSDEVIDACFTTEDPAISKRLMRHSTHNAICIETLTSNTRRTESIQHSIHGYRKVLSSIQH